MKKILQNKNFLVVTGIIMLAVSTRLMPHLMNFTPIGAIALFGGAYYGRKILAFIVPILALLLSDFVLNNTLYASYFDGLTWVSFFQIFTIGAIALTALIGIKALKKVSVLRVIATGAGAAVLFYVLTSFGSWIGPGTIYPQNAAGLIACYVAGIPFFLNTLLSNLIYGTIIFGIYEMYTNKTLTLAYVKNND